MRVAEAHEARSFRVFGDAQLKLDPAQLVGRATGWAHRSSS
jgi:hypothetical protein